MTAMTTAHRSDRGRQRGQAMVELVIVAAFVLVPLFLAIPIIGKYIDVRTAAVEASRYAAWERTVWYGGASASTISWSDVTPDSPTPFDWFNDLLAMPAGWFKSSNSWQANEKKDAHIRNEIAVRLLSRPSPTLALDAFSSADKDASEFRNNATRTLWRTRNDTPLLQDYKDVSNTIGNDGAPGIANKVLKPVALLAAVLGPFTLEMNGEYKASVTVNVANYDWYRDRAPRLDESLGIQPTAAKLGFSERTVLLANGWNAGAPDSQKVTSVRSQVAGLTPFSIFKYKLPEPTSDMGSAMNIFKTLARKVVDVVENAILILFPEFDKLDLGKIEPDKVPADRLSTGAAKPPSDE